MKWTLITGIIGRDGLYLAELSLSKGYEVYNIIRKSSMFNSWRIDHLYQDTHENSHLKLNYVDLLDSGVLPTIFGTVKLEEVHYMDGEQKNG